MAATYQFVAASSKMKLNSSCLTDLGPVQTCQFAGGLPALHRTDRPGSAKPGGAQFKSVLVKNHVAATKGRQQVRHSNLLVMLPGFGLQ
jgi:hypothetical protein